MLKAASLQKLVFVEDLTLRQGQGGHPSARCGISESYYSNRRSVADTARDGRSAAGESGETAVLFLVDYAQLVGEFVHVPRLHREVPRQQFTT